RGGAVDVELFERGVQAASLEPDIDKAIAKFEEAAQLYRGELMHDLPDEEWCWTERQRLPELYLSGLGRLASLYEQKDNYDSALVCYKQILTLDECREEIHRAV
ncbi:MAG: bacterial transcriptional activator domain-containing protein, partial [Chloroflexi bacterium]|nr:bacterial transcriptional activator domain-containing protein [Chloroflexota bacterium]